MKRIYGKTCKELILDFIKANKIIAGNVIEKREVRNWFKKNYPKIKEGTINCHLIKLSINAPSRIYYNIKSDGSDDIFYQINSNSIRLYNKNNDPKPIYKGSSSIDTEYDNEKDSTGTAFAYENDLKNYLAKNMDIIESGLKLYEDEDKSINGIEFDAGGRFIDILSIDKNNNYVVIELKVSKGYDKVVGQLLRYINWVKTNMAEENQTVRGIVICRNISEDLKLACKGLENIKLFEYALSINLKKIDITT